MASHELDEVLTAYLADAAAEAGTDVNSLLRRVLTVDAVTENPRFKPYLNGLRGDTITLVEVVDRSIRVLNPGLHHVFRDTFIGYRRPHKGAEGPIAERSQMFVSLLVRRKGIAAVLPLDPHIYFEHSSVRDLTGVGHHGVGDLQFDMLTLDDVRDFLQTFSEWLRSD